ncbi:tetratricopeptide repeat protein [Colwellia sp. MEBiC06753]
MNIVSVLKLPIICTVLLLASTIAQAQQTREVVVNNIDRINTLYDQDKETLPYDAIVGLSTEVVQFRQQYPNEVIAKAYSLMAEVANRKGDAARAFQFAVDGLTYQPLPTELQLNLELKLAAGYFVKGKYHNVFHFVDQALVRAKEEGLVKYQLLALSFRSMANALLGKNQIASDDLQAAKSLIELNQQYADHLGLLEIIAISYHYLGEYQIAMDMNERILKLRFSMNKYNGIDRTYYNLARAYREIGRLDDAYNAYWEVKKISEQNNWTIKRAYAELGLGQVLLDQEDYDNAYLALVEAENSFKGQNLNKPYLTTLIAFAKASFATNREAFGNHLLALAEGLVDITEVDRQQIELFLMLAKRYKAEGNIEKAFLMLNQYVDLRNQFNLGNTTDGSAKTKQLPVEETNKELALNLAESYEVHAEFNEKLQRLQMLADILTLLLMIAVFIIVIQWFNYRSKKQHYTYEQLERPAHFLATPAQTKYIYHRAFKKARKYQYPLTVGYLTVSNWQDLTYTFNKKIVNEVSKTIATLINEHLGEFDQTGQINDGEYLVLYPHQTKAEAKLVFEKLIDALKVRFFANLGEFSVNIRFSLDTPAVQDIDPYIFLSRLSDVS